LGSLGTGTALEVPSLCPSSTNPELKFMERKTVDVTGIEPVTLASERTGEAVNSIVGVAYTENQ
jgi:hypothetical protein